MTESIGMGPAVRVGDRPRGATLGAVAVIAAALVGAAVGIATSTVLPQLADRTNALFAPVGAVLTVCHVLTLLGVVALARTGAAGSGWLARVAYAVAFLGLGAQVAGEAVLRANYDLGTAIFGFASPAMALGFVLLGIAVLRARNWHGWHRVTPLLCGVYVPVVLIPAFIAAGGVSFPAITAWQVCFLLLGVAMLQTSPSHH